MCQYSVLAKRPNGVIRYCHDCRTYNLIFNNLLMNFDQFGFHGFKTNLSACYEHHIKEHYPENRDIKNITFNTKLDGMQLLFSTNEVAVILSMMQDAELTFMEVGGLGQEYFL